MKNKTQCVIALGLILAALVLSGCDPFVSTVNDQTISLDARAYVKQAFTSAQVTASADDGNVPQNTIDGSLSTRWSASGDGQWIQYDCGSSKLVGYINLAFYNGTARTSTFDVVVYDTGLTNPRTLLSRQVSALSNSLQTFNFADTNARYVRIVGHGNSLNLWNSYTEAEVWVGDVVITPTPVTPTPVTPTPATPTPAIAKFVLTTPQVTASTSDANVSGNTIDGNLATRWSGDGDGAWIQFDLGSVKTVAYVKIAFYNGASRTSTFDVVVYDANLANPQTVLSNKVSALNTSLQTFDFADVTGRYVRIVGHGNSSNTWNSYTEVEVWGSGNVVITPTPVTPTPVTPTPVTPTPVTPTPVTPTPVTPTPSGTIYNVSSSSQWSTAVSAAQPGDIINITANITSGISMTGKNGLAGKPITVKANTRLGVSLYSLTLTNCSYISVEGFKFGPNTAGTLMKVVNSTNIKITRNSFDHYNISTGQSSIVCTQATADIELSYNIFDRKNIGTVSGSYIKFQDDEDGRITKRAWIHHNHFKNIVPMPDGSTFRGDSDRETIVTGIAASQEYMTDHVIEYNLFEDCDGENEIITVKTSRNIIRYNTFINCLGSISVRFGTLTEVYGNFMFGSGASATMTDPNHETGGIRLYGSYHKVYDNYMEGLSGTTWRVPILLDGGDTSDSSGGDSHERVSYTDVAYNTIVNCANGIGFGINYSIAPLNCKVGSNIIANSKGALFTVTKQTGCIFEGNIAYPTGTATIGGTYTQAQVWNTNPLLSEGADSLFRIASNSPAVGYGKTYSYVTTDMDGQARSTPDAGADEYSTAGVTRRPMTSTTVGPNA